MKRALAIAFQIVLLSGYAAAEDKLKPFVDYFAKMIQGLSSPLVRFFYLRNPLPLL
jgi:hypothetical protein